MNTSEMLKASKELRATYRAVPSYAGKWAVQDTRTLELYHYGKPRRFCEQRAVDLNQAAPSPMKSSEILAAARAHYLRLPDGSVIKRRPLSAGHLTYCICFSLKYLYCDLEGHLLGLSINSSETELAKQFRAVRRHVMSSLHPFANYSDWVSVRHTELWRTTPPDKRRQRAQEGRHRWVNWLIKQYKAKGD